MDSIITRAGKSVSVSVWEGVGASSSSVGTLSELVCSNLQQLLHFTWLPTSRSATPWTKSGTAAPSCRGAALKNMKMK